MRAPLLVTLLVSAQVVLAQIPGFGGGPKIPGIPGLDAIFRKGPAITTSLPDCKWEVKDRDSFNPPAGDIFSLDRTPTGGFVLKPGAWSGVLASYCLKAGTHGPGGGEAYLFAPPKGPYEKAVVAIGQNSYAKPDIPQSRIQLLLWALIARTKISDLSNELKAVAAQLLTAKQIADMNGGALAILADEAMSRGLIDTPPLLRQVYEAENNLRRMFAGPNLAFSEFERIAVLTGDAPWGPGSRETPSGRWSLHPDGFYVQYLPSGYDNTRVTVYAPEGSKAIGKAFEPSLHIAVPTNTARQRLFQTGRRYSRN